MPRIELHPKTGLPTVAEEGGHHDVPSTRRTARPETTAREEVLGVVATEPGKSDGHLANQPSVPIGLTILACMMTQ